MKIEVVILLYNRLEHTKKIFQSIVNNKITKVTAYLDFPKNKKDKIIQTKIKKFIKNKNGIRINLIERTESYGLAKSVISAVNESFNRGYNGVVLLEDDCILLDGAKDFFFEGLKSLKDNKKIRSLCGYNLLGKKAIIDPNADLLLMNRFLTWGWATWKDRWVEYESNLRKIVSETKRKGIDIKNFSSDMKLLTSSKEYLDGSKNIWSISWILSHYLTSTYTVYPPESLIYNIGFDGSGINSIKTNVFNIKDKSSRKKHMYNWKQLTYYVENDILINEFMDKNIEKIYPSIKK